MASILPPPSPTESVEWTGTTLTRYFPSWIRLKPDTSNQNMETFFESAVPTMDRLYSLIDIFSGLGNLDDPSIAAPRLSWVYNAETSFSNPTITIKTSSDSGYTTVRRATSIFDFMTAPDLVFSIDDSGLIYFRNLAQLQDDLTVSTSSITASSGTLMEDEDIYVNYENKWHKLAPLDSQVNMSGSTITLETTSTTASIRYTATERVSAIATPCLYINNSGPLLLQEYDLWNTYDEHALRVGISRLTNETNTDLLARIKSIYYCRPSQTLLGITASIGRNIGLIGFVTWDGITTLDFASSGISGVTNILIESLPLVSTSYNEVLTHIASSTHASEHYDWLDGWVVKVNGAHITEGNYPYPSLSGSILSFTTTGISGSISATYSFENYSFTTSGVSAYLRKNNNTLPGSYTVVYIKDITIESAIDEDFQRSQLLTVDGSPNESFLRIAKNAISGMSVIMGSAVWGNNAHWLDDSEATPVISNIPIVLK